jgi:hypothetical protein
VRLPCAAQYVKWANKSDLDAFWTDAKVKRLFKNHIDAITSRINIYNGARTPGHVFVLSLQVQCITKQCPDFLPMWLPRPPAWADHPLCMQRQHAK